MRHFSVCVCCVIFLFLLNLKLDWVKSLYFLVGALHQLVVSDHRIGSPRTSSIFSVDSGVRRGAEKRKLIFLNREKRSPRQLIAWRLVIAMDVLHVNKSCPAFPVKRPRTKPTSGPGSLFNCPLAVDPRCLLEIFIPLSLTKIVKKKQ